MNANAAIFCPFCNSTGVAAPVLSPMATTIVNVASTEPHDVSPSPLQPSFMYCCGRCGYAELHDRLIEEQK